MTNFNSLPADQLEKEKRVHSKKRDNKTIRHFIDWQGLTDKESLYFITVLLTYKLKGTLKKYQAESVSGNSWMDILNDEAEMSVAEDSTLGEQLIFRR